MTILVTGGAGYIGSHVVRALVRCGRDVVVVDDLSAGRVERVPELVPLSVATLLDERAVARVFAAHRVDVVMHLAARKAVGESVRRPLDYYRANLAGLHNVLTQCVRTGVRQVVLSSSAAIYGDVDVPGVRESVRTEPINPFGRSKLTSEWMLQDAARASGLSWTALRYFNVGGAAGGDLADRDGDNLLPRLLRAVQTGARPQVFGADFPTPDGTCVRDYVHVEDVAEAHLATLARPQPRGHGATYNVGSGTGTSVLKMLTAVERVTGVRLDPLFRPRRAGDPASVVADVSAIAAALGWTATRSLYDIVASAWSASAGAMRRHPEMVRDGAA